MVSLSLDSPVVSGYILYSALLALKLIAMSVLTGLTRVGKGVYSNPEDTKALGGKVKFDDPTVERLRRAHLNDLENIVPFWLIGALYLTTGPGSWALWLFRVFAAGRALHTLVYCIVPLPQPARGIAFGIPYAIMFYMGVQIALYYLTAL